MNQRDLDDQIRRGLAALTQRARLATEAVARVDNRLLSLPRHMAVPEDVFELVTLVTTDVTEYLGKLGGSLVEKSGALVFTPQTENLSGAARIAILARTDQKLKHCEELLVKAVKMVDGDMDVWGNAIAHGAGWDK